ncbi:MAG: DUF192 domain-containing protein [Bdellovibrionota bacterium]
MRKSIVALWLIFALSACTESRPSVDLTFKSADTALSPVIRAEVVSRRSEKQMGLMYRKELGSDEGMLFVFREEKPRTFWMKNTYLELDMIFLDHDFHVVSVVKRAVPLTETPRESVKPAQYVLEVRGGSAETWKVGEGVRAEVQGSLPEAED